MSREVENGGLAVTEGGQESQHDILIVSTVACVGKSSLVAILAPVDSNAAGPSRGSKEREQERDEEERESTPGLRSHC